MKKRTCLILLALCGSGNAKLHAYAGVFFTASLNLYAHSSQGNVIPPGTKITYSASTDPNGHTTQGDKLVGFDGRVEGLTVPAPQKPGDTITVILTSWIGKTGLRGTIHGTSPDGKTWNIAGKTATLHAFAYGPI